MSMTISGDAGITFPNASTQTVSATTLGYQTSDQVTTTATNIVSSLSLGIGQTWQTPTRSAGTTYTNTTGRPILVSVSANTNASDTWYWTFTVNSVQIYFSYGGGGAPAYYYFPYVAVIPPGASYIMNITGTGGGPVIWAELR